MSLVMVIMIAVSLSMDAFSLSLAYGTLGVNKKDRILLSSIVGLYHFFMPLIGMWIGNEILKWIPLDPNLIVLAVLTVIGVQMILESFNEDREIKVMHFLELFSFGLAVSIDSFSVGLGLKAIYHTPIICSFIFMVSSFFFTNLGLKLGNKMNEKLGKIATRIGGIMLIILGILYMI